MKKLFLALFVAIPLFGLCQSYVFCPEIKTEVKHGLSGMDVSFVFKDSRVYEKKLNEKCTKTEIFNEFANCFYRTYPDIKISILDENDFDKNPAKGIFTLKIDFLDYEATFYTGMYIANTKFLVKIFDNRDGEYFNQDTIMGYGKQFNALGFKSGKIALNSSFKEAFDKFTLLADNLKLMTKSQKSVKQVTPITKSKADRLRELKQLLDENILTQEEYDKEKKKILDENE
jgi:hypothetical protein